MKYFLVHIGTMFIDTSTKEFTAIAINIAISSMASQSNTFYTTRWLPMFTKNSIIFLKTRHIRFLFVNRFLSR